MASLLPGFEYDIFISYRQKDNKGDKWVSRFVDALKTELEATFKEDVSVYFDENPHDRLQETHNVDKSLEGKLKCLIFIPILSQTYCDQNSYAWQNEFLTFLKMAEKDPFGKDIRLRSGNVGSRVLPIRIHDLEQDDIRLFEKETGSVLRAMDFVFKTATGVNRPLQSFEERPGENLNKTLYRDQVNKVANAIKEIILGMQKEPDHDTEEKETPKEARQRVISAGLEKPKPGKRKFIPIVLIVILLVIIAVFAYPKIFRSDELEKLRSTDGRISVAVMPFKNMTIDTTWNDWQNLIQNELVNSLSYSEELKVKQIELIDYLLQSKGLTNYSSITPSIASSISQKLDANVFIYGSITQVGNKIRLNAQLIDSKTEDVLKPFQIEDRKEYISFRIIDSLSMMVKNFLIISKLGKAEPLDAQHLASTNSSEAYRYFTYGQKAYLNLDFATAVKWYSQAVAKDSNFIFAILRLSYACSSLGLFDQGKRWCLKAYTKRELMTLQQKSFTDYVYAINFETPYQQIEYARRGIEIDDQLPMFYYFLGLSYVGLSQYDKAIPEFEKALEVYKRWDSKPMWVLNYTYLGIAYHKTEQYKKEKQLYQKAEMDFPDNYRLIYSQAILALTERDTVKANEYIEKYKSIRIDNGLSEADISVNVAAIYNEAGILNKAEKYYRRALKLEPEIPNRLNSLAYFLTDKDLNISEGLRLIEKALELSPDNYSFLETKGWALYKQGKYNEALEILEKSWNLKPRYIHRTYLHIQQAKKAVAGLKLN